MKTLYLRGSNYAWQLHTYENISDLAEELKNRNISIGDGARIGYRASIGDDASIGYRARIGAKIKLITGLFFSGSAHSVTYAGEGYICIGCHKKTIEEWVNKYSEIGKKENYTDEQIAEYAGYINMIKLCYENGIIKEVELK